MKYISSYLDIKHYLVLVYLVWEISLLETKINNPSTPGLGSVSVLKRAANTTIDFNVFSAVI